MTAFPDTDCIPHVILQQAISGDNNFFRIIVHCRVHAPKEMFIIITYYNV